MQPPAERQMRKLLEVRLVDPVLHALPEQVPVEIGLVDISIQRGELGLGSVPITHLNAFIPCSARIRIVNTGER